MADDKKNIEKKAGEKAEELKSKGADKYEALIDKLYEQRNNLRNELDREYNEARRYISSNPEEGVLIGLVGGFVMGILLSRWFK